MFHQNFIKINYVYRCLLELKRKPSCLLLLCYDCIFYIWNHNYNWPLNICFAFERVHLTLTYKHHFLKILFLKTYIQVSKIYFVFQNKNGATGSAVTDKLKMRIGLTHFLFTGGWYHCCYIRCHWYRLASLPIHWRLISLLLF